jgi:hypothetical protein
MERLLQVFSTGTEKEEISGFSGFERCIRKAKGA